MHNKLRCKNIFLIYMKCAKKKKTEIKCEMCSIK